MCSDCPFGSACTMIDALRDQLLMRGIDPLQDKRFLVRKRDGRIEEFNEARILLAIESAFRAFHNLGQDASLPEPAPAAAKHCAEMVVKRVLGRAVRGEELEVERIQDTVEEQLMLAGHLEVARRYILYREARRLARAAREGRVKPSPSLNPASDSPAAAFGSALPELKSLYSQVLPKQRDGQNFEDIYRRHFDGCLNEGDYWRSLSPELLEFDSNSLARGLRLERDQQFAAAGLAALREKYLLRENSRCFEAPQYFWMRIAMGLALNEGERREARALDFYEALSTFRFIPSDRILTHAGTPRPSLSDASEADLSSGWIEPWHRDILDSLDARKLWLPDLFMQRVRQQASWSLFDPAETGDLHDSCGSAFETRYLAYEQKAKRGELRFSKRVKAVDLWHQIVTTAAQTGPMRIGFKDAIGLRSLQPDHASAACPLGAINLAAHISESGGGLDVALLSGTITAAVRMLDNAVDLSLYPTEQARLNALEHRVIGLGIAGFQEAVLQLKYQSAAAADFADWSMELVSCRAIMASAELARERGPFPGYAESKWREGILPIDTLGRLSQERGLPVDVPADTSQDWASVREMIQRHGMRNSATTAISSLDIPVCIAGVTSSIDPSHPGKKTGPKWLIECAARRQKWIDMGQTLTLRAPEGDPDKLAELYMLAWEKGIKTMRQDNLPAPAAEEPKPKAMAAAVLA
jgi:ribonucleotide reductase alpha subunit